MKNEEINVVLTEYYKALYKNEDKEKERSHFLNDLPGPKLREDQRRQLDEEITPAEIGLALEELKSGKTSGVDGLPAEFYKTFWRFLKPFFVKLINEIVKDGKLHLSARRGIITLIEKPDKEPLYIDNWRPISLLCADYKIYSKIIAKRLQLVLPSLIHPSQTGFMKGRNIGENTIQLLSLMEYAQIWNKSVAVISFDFRKAFDRVSWSAIDQVLDYFEFGETFKKLVKILYSETLSCVINNGFWGEWFQLERSTRQGCPASPLVFNLIVEPLGLKIRNSVKIQGIEMFDFEMKSAQYADNIWVCLKPSSENINNLLQVMEEFRLFAGLDINYNKTVAFKLGPCRDTQAKYYTIKKLCWTENPVKILGIWFHTDKEIMEEYNFYRKIPKIKALLQLWKSRHLTLLGKISIINTLALSQFMYQLAACHSPSERFFKEIKKVIMDFLWEEKPPKIAYNKIIQDYENGGLKLIDLETKEIALKARWPLHWGGAETTVVLWISSNRYSRNMVR